jgi:IS30 family transposase
MSIAAPRSRDRPAVVQDRQRVGDREDDLIVGRMSRSAIGTLVDRRSRYVRLLHLPAGHSAGQLRAAIEPVLASLPGRARCRLGSVAGQFDLQARAQFLLIK